MNESLKMLHQAIVTVADYPQKGVMFRDITELLKNAKTFSLSINLIAEAFRDQGITKVVGTEARGLMFAAPVAYCLGIGFVPVRKPGKLPRERLSESYDLEYGKSQLEIHKDAITDQDNVLIIDDLLATGGTLEATVKLIRRLGGQVHQVAVLIELLQLGGRKRLAQHNVECFTLLSFD